MHPPAHSIATNQDPSQTTRPSARSQENKKQSSTGQLNKKERKNVATKKTTAAVRSNVVDQFSNDMMPPSPSMTPRNSSPEGDFAQDHARMQNPLQSLNSPVLHALPSTSPKWAATEWARNVSAYSSSPGNLISLGESPPTMPSSLDDDRPLYQIPHKQRPFTESHASPIPIPYSSSPNSAVDMNSYNGHFVSPRDTTIGYRNRDSSISSKHTPKQHVGSQQHQKRASFLSVGFGGLPAAQPTGFSGHYGAFDSIEGFVAEGNRKLDNVVISGYDGGVTIYNLTRTGLARIATIDGLRGAVHCAKIIPYGGDATFEASFPLIVLVVHGPQKTTDEDTSTVDANHPVAYQTTVEVYSIAQNKHITTLMSMPAAQTRRSSDHVHTQIPEPAGGLTLTVDSTTILVSSGITGEVWIFRQHSDLVYCCVGKIWAAVQTISVTNPTDADEYEAMAGESRSSLVTTQATIVSLRGRWLAYTPSVSKEQISMRATVHATTSSVIAYGLTTYTPPVQPNITCATDASDSEKLLSHVTRAVTQGVVKSAKFVAKEGYKAWDSYWATTGQPTSTNANKSYIGQTTEFPPTHGEGIPTSLFTPKASLISLIDLEQLSLSQRSSATSAPPSPFLTFKPPHGCSFLSFSPNGLNLFTASENGDVQIVWDLMKMLRTKSSLLQVKHSTDIEGVHVRQVALFTRLTATKIVDAVWSSPLGDNIAVITDRNTIHFLDLPASSLAWPAPLRRKVAERKAPQSEDSDVNAVSATATITSNAVSAVKGLRSYAIPFIPHRASGAIRTPMTTASIANAGTGFVTGLSKSMGAAASGTLEHFRKAGDNKLHLPTRKGPVTPGAIKWVGSPRAECIVANVDGVIHVYPYKQSFYDTRSRKHRVIVSGSPTRYALPSPEMHHKDSNSTSQGLQAHPTLVRITRMTKTESVGYAGKESSIPHAEIDPSAPYQPFHTDRRISLHVYQSVQTDSISDTTSRPDDKWIFGRPIASTMVHTQTRYSSEGDDVYPPSSSDVERITTEEDNQIVSTTRRRRVGLQGQGGAEDIDDGFFEDDCEVLDFAHQRV